MARSMPYSGGSGGESFTWHAVSSSDTARGMSGECHICFIARSRVRPCFLLLYTGQKVLPYKALGGTTDTAVAYQMLMCYGSLLSENGSFLVSFNI